MPDPLRIAIPVLLVCGLAHAADEVVLSPVGVGPDPEASYDRTLEVLGELARSR